MSENYLRFIPTEPEYVPTVMAEQQARALLASFFVRSVEIGVDRYDAVQFVDAGSNWEGVFCPTCGTIVDDTIWSDLVDQAFRTQFTDLTVSMPCCDTASSLNDLRYEWPVGFARLVLQIRDPNGDISQEQVRQLEAVLGCHLRKIWAHY